MENRDGFIYDIVSEKYIPEYAFKFKCLKTSVTEMRKYYGVNEERFLAFFERLEVFLNLFASEEAESLK